MEVGLIVLAWLVVGWLPSRIEKHYYVCSPAFRCVPWKWQDELLPAAMAVAGPMNALATLIWRRWPIVDRETPWGWRW